MREIKFRAWDRLEKKMVYIDPLRLNSWDGQIDSGWYEDENGSHALWQEFNEGRVMQYTGLKDRDGNEIYEGDYMNDGLFRVRVDWNGDIASFVCGDQPLWHFTEEGRYEVEGNIHENPELLK